MLLKLLKYDVRAMWHQFALIWVGALVLGSVNRFTIPWNSQHISGLIQTIAMSSLVAVLIAMFVLVMVFVIQRFYRGLLTREGYLMHTLPVHAWELVLSKLLSGVAAACISGAVAVLTLLVMVPVKWSELFQFQVWWELSSVAFRHLDGVIQLLEFLLELLLVLVSALVFCISQVYFSITVGHLFPRRRVFMSTAAYFAIVTLILPAAARAAHQVGLFGWIDIMPGFFRLPFAALVLLIPSALFLWGAAWILEHKLNLD